MPADETSSPHLFKFDLDRAIRERVVEALERSPLLALRKDAGPKLSGIYALYWKGRLVYVGKATKGLTRSKRDLFTRLSAHAEKIDGRQNITLSEMTYRYLTFESNWCVFAAECVLIAHYKPEWNNMGFDSGAMTFAAGLT